MAPAAEAQTVRTYTFVATVGGTPCTECRVNEGESITFTLTVSGISSGSLTAQWDTPEYRGSATVGEDYDRFLWRGNAIVLGDPGLLSTQTSTIIDDLIAERDETIIVPVPVVTPAVAGHDTFTTTSTDITITIPRNDQEPILTVAVDDANTVEGDIAVFTVALAGLAPAPGSPVSVDWAVSGVDAADYTVSGADTDGTLRFTALGSQTLSFAIATDGAQEPAETLTLTLSNASEGVISVASAATTIAASIASVRTLTVTGADTHTETNAASMITYTVAMEAADTLFAAATAVTWTVTPGTAQAADFSAVTGTVQFATTDRSQTFMVAVAGDNLNEPEEIFTVQVSVANAGADGGTAFGPAAGTTITDDDAVTVAITRASGTGAVAESSGTLSFTVTVAGGTRASGVSTVVPFTIGGAGITAADYDITAPTGLAASATGGSVTIAQSASTATITVTITDDSLNEAQEMLTVTGGGLSLVGTGAGGVQYAGGGDTVSVAVTDNDDITVSIAAPSPATVTESGTAEFAVTLSGASAGSAAAITVAYTVSGTTDTPTDANAGSIEIAAGDTTGTITLGIPFSQALGATDPAETLTVTLGAITRGGGAGMVSAAASPGNAASVTVNYITDARTLSVTGPPSIAEGTAATFTVGITGTAFTRPTAVTWTIADPDDDFAVASGSVTFPTQTTFTVTPRADSRSEAAESFTVNIAVADRNADGGTAPASATFSVGASDAITTITVRGPATVNEESSAVYTVDLGAEVVGTTPVTVTIMRGSDSTAMTPRDYSISPAAPIEIPDGQRTGTFTLTTTDGGGDGTDDRTLTLTLTAMGGANTAGMASVTQTITITEDDPAAREARLEAPAAAAARGVGQLAAGAVVGRLTAAVAGGNTLTLAGQNMNGNGMETLAAQYLAGERELSAAELLRQSGFSFTHGDGGRGFNFWGGGSYVSADGDHDGVSYDGDTTAFHVGIDTHWRDGLIGVAVGTSDGDTDFTVTADGMKSTLETDVTSVHPYLTRRFSNSQLWITAGHGSGDAELKEPGTVIKTDITVTTAAFGITHARGDIFVGGLSALYSRAKLDAAEGSGKTLPATTADGLRIVADAEVGKRIGNLRPFAVFAFRHDSGDGDTGGAADLGGGLEYRAPTVLVRLEGSGHIQGQGPDESRVSLTARKTSGRLSLGLNLGADETGLDTARLLYGEWRF